MAHFERFEIGARETGADGWEALPEELLQKVLATGPCYRTCTEDKATAGIVSAG